MFKAHKGSDFQLKRRENYSSDELTAAVRVGAQPLVAELRLPGLDEHQEEAQTGPDLGVGPHLGTRQSMTAENLKQRMRNPRFGVVYRNFQLSWAKLRIEKFTEPLAVCPILQTGGFLTIKNMDIRRV